MSAVIVGAEKKPHNAWDDTRLVKECIAGNEGAWSLLIDKYKALIYSIPIKYRLPPQEAADVFQSTCMELLERLSELREPRALPKWLMQVAHHQCYRVKRQQQRLVSRDAEPDLPVPETPAIAETLMQQTQEEQMLREAIGNLTPQCRRLVELLFSQLAQLESEAARRKFLTRHPALVHAEIVDRLARLVVERVRVDTREAVHLAEAAVLIGKRLRRKESLALGLRAKANALYASGDNAAAVEHHEKAVELYDALKIEKEAARTLSSSIQPLILLGEYDKAFKAAARAREIFTRLDDPWRLARLEINLGNVFHRQDRFDEAIAHYERAYGDLLPYKDAEGIAVVLSNMAMCLISLNDFPRALDCYRKAREACERYGMPLLRDQADYNIAYLYYFRGEYSRAIEMLFATRRACEVTGDAYHLALCHLDLSEIYLELNLSEEAREMAQEGFLRFEKLGMGYEAAKTLANEAIAYGQQGKTVHALERFAKARDMFAREKNLVWPWLLDLYQALLLFHEGRYFEARRLCVGAAGFFDQTLLSGKAVLAHFLLARIAMHIGEPSVAESETDAALARIERLQVPVLAYEAHFLRGQLAHARGDRPAALGAYVEARKALETLRSRLHSEELKISFVKNRLQVYEALVDLHLSGDTGEATDMEAFACIEAAKSRSMSEMIFQSGQSLPMG